MLDLPLIEEAVIPDIFISGIGRIEKLAGGMVRVVYYAERQIEPGLIEHVVVAKLVRPIATLIDAMRILRNTLAEADIPFIAAGGKIVPMN